MADNDSTNTSPTRQLTGEALATLTDRLVTHADGIENIAAQGMADDMRLAAQAVSRLMNAPADILVDIRGDDGTSRRNVPLREAIGDDAEEYQDCRQTLLADGKCTTGGGASPLYHLELVGNKELALLRAGIRRAIDSTTDPVCRARAVCRPPIALPSSRRRPSARSHVLPTAR